MVCLCSLQTAKCTQCSGQDRENGTWQRAFFLILGHLEWGLGTHTGSSSHGDGARLPSPSLAVDSPGLLTMQRTTFLCSSVIWMTLIVFKFSYTLNDLI